MPVTNGDIIDDVLYTMGFDVDDALLHRVNVGYNLGLVIDRIKRQRLEKELRSPLGSRGVTNELTTYIVPIEHDSTLNNRSYFVLPSNVYDIRINGGVGYIAYAAGSGCRDALVGRHFTLASPSEMNMLQGHGLQQPAPENPYYFRARINTTTGIVTDRVWLYGPGATVSDVEVGLYLTTPSVDALDPDAEVDAPEDMLYLVKRMMLDLGRWALLVPGQRLKNDGRDFPPSNQPQPLQPPQNVSVNDPINISIE